MAMLNWGEMHASCWRIFVLAPLFLLAFPQSALAVQQHGGAEGLISHQLGHLLFIAGMFYLLYRLHLSSPVGPGWFQFRLFVWIIIAWNLLTFYGHWHRELIDPAKFLIENGETKGFVISGPLDVLFYFSRLDHLLLVPAFLFLLAGLKKWRKNA